MTDTYGAGFLFELVYDDVDTAEGIVGHDYPIDDHGSKIEFPCALRAVTH